MSVAHRLGLVVAACLLVGLCIVPLVAAEGDSNNKGKIEGTKWSSQATKFQEKDAPAGTLKLEFGKDNSLVFTAGRGVFKGTYSLGAGNKVTFKIGPESVQETIVIAGDTLTMTDPKGTAVKFSKVK